MLKRKNNERRRGPGEASFTRGLTLENSFFLKIMLEIMKGTDTNEAIC